MKANLDVNQCLRRPFQSMQSLCAFRLPTALTLPFSAAPHLCPLPIPLLLLRPLGSPLLLDAPFRVCSFSVFHLMHTCDSICVEPQISSRSSLAPWQTHTHRNSRRAAGGIATAHPPHSQKPPRLRRPHPMPHKCFGQNCY